MINLYTAIEVNMTSYNQGISAAKQNPNRSLHYPMIKNPYPSELLGNCETEKDFMQYAKCCFWNAGFYEVHWDYYYNDPDKLEVKEQPMLWE